MQLYEAAKTLLRLCPADNLDLRKAVMDMMSLALEVDEELVVLKRRVVELESAQITDSSLQLDHGVYWKVDENSSISGPYCPACWGKDRRLVPMLLKETALPGSFWATCSIHASDLNFTVRKPMIS